MKSKSRMRCATCDESVSWPSRMARSARSLDQIDEPQRQGGELDVHLGVALVELGRERHQRDLREALGHGDPERAPRRVAAVGRPLRREVELIDQRLHPLEVGPRRGRRRKRSRRPLEEPHLQVVLEPRDDARAIDEGSTFLARATAAKLPRRMTSTKTRIASVSTPRAWHASPSQRSRLTTCVPSEGCPR